MISILKHTHITQSNMQNTHPSRTKTQPKTQQHNATRLKHNATSKTTKRNTYEQARKHNTTQLKHNANKKHETHTTPSWHPSKPAPPLGFLGMLYHAFFLNRKKQMFSDPIISPFKCYAYACIFDPDARGVANYCDPPHSTSHYTRTLWLPNTTSTALFCFRLPFYPLWTIVHRTPHTHTHSIYVLYVYPFALRQKTCANLCKRSG